jgi:hypothetical protein
MPVPGKPIHHSSGLHSYGNTTVNGDILIVWYVDWIASGSPVSINRTFGCGWSAWERIINAGVAKVIEALWA